MDIKMDMAFCSSECSVTNCFRNRKNIPEQLAEYEIILANLEGTDYCLKKCEICLRNVGCDWDPEECHFVLDPREAKENG